MDFARASNLLEASFFTGGGAVSGASFFTMCRSVLWVAVVMAWIGSVSHPTPTHAAHRHREASSPTTRFFVSVASVTLRLVRGF